MNNLFRGLPEPSFVYRSEQCEVTKFRNSQGRLEIYKWRTNAKSLFLKPLWKLFYSNSDVFTPNNTIIVDTLRTQTFMNRDQNVVLFKPWKEDGDRSLDGVFMDQFLPWIRRLHSRKGVDLWDFRFRNTVGEMTLYQASAHTLWDEIATVFIESLRLFR